MTSLIFTIVLRVALVFENRRRDRLTKEQYEHEAAIKDPCDWVSSHLNLLVFYHSSLSAS